MCSQFQDYQFGVFILQISNTSSNYITNTTKFILALQMSLTDAPKHKNISTRNCP